MAFTYGWTHEEILRLTVKQFQMYLEQANYLETAEHSRDIEASVFPHLRASDRARILRPIQAILYERQTSERIEQERIDASWDSLRRKK